MSIIDKLSVGRFERKVWDMFDSGMPVSKIAYDIGVDFQTVKDVIVGIWKADNEAHKASWAAMRVEEYKAKMAERKADEEQEDKYDFIEF